MKGDDLCFVLTWFLVSLDVAQTLILEGSVNKTDALLPTPDY